MRFLACSLLFCLLAGVCRSAEPLDDTPNETPNETLAKPAADPRIRVDICFAGRAEDAPAGLMGLGNLSPLEVKCEVRRDLRAENFLIWFILPANSKNMFRLWRDVDKTDEIMPQIDGDSAPFDYFRVDDLPELIWVESSDVGTGSISVGRFERRVPPPNDI